MKAAFVLLVSAALVAVATGRVLPLRTEAPAGWTLLGRATDNSLVQIQFALKQQNLDEFDRRFWELSDPQHPNYQNYMTVQEIRDLLSPSEEVKSPLFSWFMSNGVNFETHITDFGDSVRLTLPVKLAGPLLNTVFYEFSENKNSGRRLIRAMHQATIPEHLEELVEMVTGLSQFPIPHLGVKQPNADLGIVPQTINSMYKVSLPTAAGNTSQGVIEFEGQSYDNNDLIGYGNQLNIPLKALNPAHIIGPMPQASSVEGLLDIEFIAGVNPQADNWYWYNSPYTKWLYEWGTEFNAAAEVSQVISMSYAWSEMDQCNSGISGSACAQMGVDSFGYVRKVNIEFQKMGARGVSVLVASGDSGANGRTDISCTAPQLRPDYPAASPFVTSVGGTELVSATPLSSQPQLCRRFPGGCASTGTEQAVSFAISDYASGGGFSNVADMPTYQADVVGKYLASGVKLPPASYFNAKGRAFPDVAGLGHNCLCLISNTIEPVGGTSCATPIFSALVSLLNVASIQKTGKTLGFLNPLLYQMYASDPTIFSDIIKGDNLCTEGGCSPSCKGFYATKGWDPVTGLGTPNYQKMLAYVQSHL